MIKLTDDFIDGVNIRLWQEASNEFGSNIKVPSDRVFEIGDFIRALYVLQTEFAKGTSSEDALIVLRRFTISDTSIDKLFSEGVLERDVVNDEKPASRKARLQAFEAWAKENRGKKFATDFLVEQSGFSKATLLNYMKTSRLFDRVKRGTFCISDK